MILSRSQRWPGAWFCLLALGSVPPRKGGQRSRLGQAAAWLLVAMVAQISSLACWARYWQNNCLETAWVAEPLDGLEVRTATPGHGSMNRIALELAIRTATKQDSACSQTLYWRRFWRRRWYNGSNFRLRPSRNLPSRRG